jgi:hypothetical protein
MEIQTKLPFLKASALSTKSALLSSIVRASTHVPDAWLVHAVRRLAGSNQLPMGQKFLERALISLYRKPLADAHALAQSHERAHKDATSGGASERKPKTTVRVSERRAPGP